MNSQWEGEEEYQLGEGEEEVHMKEEELEEELGGMAEECWVQVFR